MEENQNSHKTFPVVFNNKIIQIDYNKLFPEYKEQTVKAKLIKMLIHIVYFVLVEINWIPQNS